MDAIYSTLMEHRFFAAAIIALIAYGFWRLTARPTAQPRVNGLVPAYERFNRREAEAGDRRRGRILPLMDGERRMEARRLAH